MDESVLAYWMPAFASMTGGGECQDHDETEIIRTAILGASGYTGADVIRLAARHPNIKITALIAKGHAGQALGQVFPHLASLNLPKLVTSDEVDWRAIDLVFCGLPHGTAHQEIAKLPERIKVIDMSADFRLNDLDVYAEWYGGKHGAPELAKEAVYGLTEHYGDRLKGARIVACHAEVDGQCRLELLVEWAPIGQPPALPDPPEVRQELLERRHERLRDVDPVRTRHLGPPGRLGRRRPGARP